MREKINEDPRTQMALLGALALIGVVFFLLRGGGETVPDATAPTTDPSATATAPTDPAAAAASGSTLTVPGSRPAPGGDLGPSSSNSGAIKELEAGPGLPEAFVKAYSDDQIVAILFYDKGGLDDRELKAEVTQQFRGEKDVKLFIESPNAVADYSQITQGVGLDRTPALIVIKPRSTTEGAPVASINYGFRGSKAIQQTLRDAVYDGGTVTVYP